jgi:hypothetical protein
MSCMPGLKTNSMWVGVRINITDRCIHNLSFDLSSLGYGQIVQNIINYIDRNGPSGFPLNTTNMQATSQTQKTPIKAQQSPQIDLVKLKNSDKSPSTPTSNTK